MPATASSGSAFPAGPLVYPTSTKGEWVTCHTNLAATASTAANLSTPYNAADTNAVWIKVPECTRVVLRAKCAVGVSAVAASPIVYVYGVDTKGDVTASTIPSDATIGPVGAKTLTGTAVTLTLAAASANTNIKDATYLYSAESDPLDLKGAAYLLVLVQTAASLTSGGTPVCEAKFLN